MSTTLARVTAAIGVWVIVAPLAFGWRLIALVFASSILPGALIALAGAYCGMALLPYGDDEAQARLSVSLTSSTLLLGVWLLLGPFLLGIALYPATYLALLVPGAAIVCLSLANGYLAWRDPEE